MQQFQDGGRPPSWISILGHNFGVDQLFLVKMRIKFIVVRSSPVKVRRVSLKVKVTFHFCQPGSLESFFTPTTVAGVKRLAASICVCVSVCVCLSAR